ncbi:glutamate-rich protein 6-like [Poecilia reticulata]|uniref:Glutamate-rich protein 6-like n=1 Tax=Poecilia reticulata TaxID=8081 RepID=A0A3P9MZU8_POERE|nr:PREDICTED: glutamate-rich protein 6-like [Poecilia reticulata]
MEPNSSRETSSDIFTVLTYDGRTVTRINVGTQTHEGLDYTSKYVSLNGEEDHYDSLEQRTDDESELTISPDNEMLDLHSEETPHSPTACQEGTEETLTNLDKLVTDEESDKEENQRHTPRQHGLKSKEGSHEDIYTHSESRATTRFETGKHFTEHVKSFVISSDFSDNESSATELEGERGMSYNSIFSFNVRKERLKTVPFIRRYKNGKIFCLVFQDGTGHVCYPTGRLAILAATSHSKNSSCVVVLENKIYEPQIKALFTSSEQTCFHENGNIWVNLTSTGGTLFSETGHVRKRWKWQGNEQHVHAPPCQPFHLTLSPFLEVHILSQEDISILFNSNKHTVEVIKVASVTTKHVSKQAAPVHDSLKSYLKQKSAEINALLQNIQSLATYQSSETTPTVDPHPADGTAAAASETATLPGRPPKEGNVLQ